MEVAVRTVHRTARRIGRVFQYKEFYLFLVVVVISTIISLQNRNFITLENFFDVIRSYSFLGILAMGVLVVLISGGIDLSFTAMATIAQYTMAVVLLRNPELNAAVALLIPLVIGTVLGSINAVLITLLDAPSIIITISTMNIYFGVLQLFSHGKWIVQFPQWFSDLSKANVITLRSAGGVAYGLSLTAVIWLCASLLTFLILRFVPIGRKVYALGGNRDAARRSGVNVLGLNLFVYGFMGLLSGIASIIHALLAMTVAPNAIMGRELDVIAAVVLGGASISGGYGTVLGTLLGVMLVAVIGNGLVLMRVSSFWHKVLLGVIIIVSVSITVIQDRSMERRVVRIDES